MSASIFVLLWITGQLPNEELGHATEIIKFRRDEIALDNFIGYVIYVNAKHHICRFPATNKMLLFSRETLTAMSQSSR